MKSIRAKLARLAAAVVASLLIVSSASAVSVTILDYSGDQTPGLAVELTENGIFQTVGGAVESFLNWASFLPAADGTGKVKISGVSLTGSAVSPFAGVYAQQTTGGLIEISDLTDTLLLSVEFTTGLLQIAQNGAGSQFSVGNVTFSGLLAPYLSTVGAGNTFSFINFTAAGIGENGSLLPGSGSGNGLVSGSEIPEPATMLLLGSGILGAALARRKA